MNLLLSKIIKSNQILKTILITIVFLTGIFTFACSDNDDGQDEINGVVRSGNQVIPGSNVSLFCSGIGSGIILLGEDVADEMGTFSISFEDPGDDNAILYLIAENDPSNIAKTNQLSDSTDVRLALMLGRLPVIDNVVINERTTVATAYAMAQFFVPGGIDGTYPGLQNAADISQNLADPSNGNVASMLNTFPNGASTTTRATFNSLANILAACVNSDAGCVQLFDLSTPPGGTSPTNTLDAAVNIAHFPWQNVDGLFEFSLLEDVYSPTLGSPEDVSAWFLAIRYVGNGMEFNGPGNTAFDADGNAWITNNFVFSDDPTDVVCGDDHVLRLTPTGEDVPGAPYQGGGLYGAGYGITLDTENNVWIGNFAFQGEGCPLEPDARAQSVSKFSPDGVPLSPNTVGNDIGGFMGAGNTLNYPQGTVSDNNGNIWISNCNGDNVTQFPGGDPDQAFVIQETDDSAETIVVAPFDIAIDTDGNAWVTGNESFNVAKFDPDGDLLLNVSGDEAAEAGFNKPMGIATDMFGNAWVANSGFVTAPCDGNSVPELRAFIALALDPDFMNPDASIIKVNSDGTEIGSFKGGGLLMPWGISVDGRGNVWVSNFDGQTVSYFCGEDTSSCPPGLETGDPIAPMGYFFNGLKRSTSVQIDPSGNVWATNNFEILAASDNPGGDSMVVFIGIAEPVNTPLIGPPES